jgi:hypothetical protein
MIKYKEYCLRLHLATSRKFNSNEDCEGTKDRAMPYLCSYLLLGSL